MRTLLLYPQLPESFWSLPINTMLAGAKTQAPPLGLLTVAALLPRSWDLRLLDLNVSRFSEGDWHWAEMVLISGMLAQRKQLLDLVREAAARGKKVVAGGPYPSALPEEILETGADIVVQGEAENTMTLLLDALREGKRGIVLAADEKPDMRLSPVPRFDLIRFKDYQFVSVQTSRGCPFDCEFCDVVRLLGRKPRYKQPEQVIRELEFLFQLGYRDNVFIADDNFIGNRGRCFDILESLTAWQRGKGQPFAFIAQASLNLGRDNAMIDALTAANFGQIFIGIESPDESALTLSHKHQNLGNPIAEAVRNINANGLTVIGSFIVGLDGEPKGADQRICGLIEEASIPINMINLLRVPPATKLWHRLENEGRLCRLELDWAECSCTDVNFTPWRPVEEIQQEYRNIWEHAYEPSRFLARAYRYFLGMRPTRTAMARMRGERLHRQVKPCKASFRREFHDAMAFLYLVWRRGITGSCRLQFWRQLVEMRKRNPSRLVAYFTACALGEDMMRIRDGIRRASLDAGP